MNSNTEEILNTLKKAYRRNKIKIIIEKDKTKLALSKEVNFEDVDFSFEFEQSIMADQELTKNIIKDIQEIKEKIKNYNEKNEGFKEIEAKINVTEKK